MIDKILLKLMGLLLVAVSILLVVRLIIIRDEDDLIIFASQVLIITVATITLILGIAFLGAKISKKKTKEKIEDDEDE
jgi:uncharacterized membrane protein